MRLQRFEFLKRARPVRSKKPGEATVGKKLSARLASRAVVRLIIGVTNSLNFCSASRTRLSI
jgi:hypothetical protein